MKLIKPMKNHVVIELVEKDDITPSGLIILHYRRELGIQGVVLEVGERKTKENIKLPPIINQNDKVFLHANAGQEVEIEGKRSCKIVHEDSILAVLEE